MTAAPTTVAEATALAIAHRWHGMRKLPNNVRWAADLAEALPGLGLADITTGHLQAYAASMRERGLAPATVSARLAVASVLYKVAVRYGGYAGAVPRIPYPRVPPRLQWWLNPDTEREVLLWCKRTNEEDLADYVRWSILTGLRVEESLAVTRRDFSGLSGASPILTVPGTKTVGAQATLPLSAEAASLALRRLDGGGAGSPLFSLTYLELWQRWTRMAKALGLPKGATLKALRRRYARDRAAKGCPLPVLQQMMRHSDPETTLRYLRLTGGQFTVKEMAQYL